MIARFRNLTSVIVVIVVAFVLAALAWRVLRPPSSSVDSAGSATSGLSSTQISPGGRLVGSVRAEPVTFNRYAAAGNRQTDETIAFLTQAKLVRINRDTDQVEPWLAESWQEVIPQAAVGDTASAAHGPVYRVKLRDGIAFSDGAPFTSADVLFAFEAIYDPRVESSLNSPLRIGGQALKARALGDHEVEITFPSPYGPGIRLLDSLWILPRHKLEPALRTGTLGQAWGLTTSASEIAGLGPFVLREYRPGERIVFERNPRYWRRDERGRQLPYLDGLILEILPDQAAELLRLQSGQLDFTHSAIRSGDYLSLKRAQEDGRVRVADLGISLDPDWFWFNLGPGERHAGKPWLRTRAFRQAVSLAVDRRAYAESVFLGAAVPIHGIVTPGNPAWYWPELPGGEYDPAQAKTLLAGLGLTDRNGDGKLEDGQGGPVQFSVLLQRGLAPVERGAAFIRSELERIGVAMTIVGVDAGTVGASWAKGDYDVVFHRIYFTDTDPASNLEFWLSSGPSHMWNPSQPKPATDWEQEIDDLMLRQVADLVHAERVRLFREAQRIFSEHVPMLHFAAERLFLATSARVTNMNPSRIVPMILWSADTLAVGGRQ